jgi:protein-S-isoprenylcysteine O-methyltransferase Ste14
MVNLPPPVWTLFYLIAATVASVLYPWKTIADLTVLPVGIAFIALGFALAFWAASLFRAQGTELNPVSAENKKLVIQGPFAYTRNPMYLGLVLVSLGIAFCAGSLPLFAVPLLVFLTANFVHIPFEEAKMRRQFSDAYEAYVRTVRRWV